MVDKHNNNMHVENLNLKPGINEFLDAQNNNNSVNNFKGCF